MKSLNWARCTLRVLAVVSMVAAIILPATAARADTTFVSVTVPPKEFLEGSAGELEVEVELDQQEPWGTIRLELVDSGLAPRFFASELVLWPATSRGTLDIVLPAQAEGVYPYHPVLTYRPSILDEFYDHQPGDVVYDCGIIEVEWKPQTAPLVLLPGNLPAVIRGRLTTDGFLLREVIEDGGAGDLDNVGGLDAVVSAPQGPFEIGVRYPVSISVSSSLAGEWENSFGVGYPGEMLARGSSAMSVYFDDSVVNIVNDKCDLKGRTTANEIIPAVVDGLTLAKLGNSVGSLLDWMLEHLALELAGTALNALASDLLSYLNPTQEVGYINHAHHPYLAADDPSAIQIIFDGEETPGLSPDLVSVSEFVLSFEVEFLEAGHHELVFVTDLRADVDVYPDGQITTDFTTQFEYRDDIILAFDVQENSEPILSSPVILPGNSGDTSTVISFQVTYTDAEDDPPDSVVVVIDSGDHQMSSSDTTYDDGAVFSYSAGTFGTGVHTYYFQATQDSTLVTTNPLNFYVTESAVGHDLRIVTMELSRRSAEPGDSVHVTAQINNVGDYTENGITADVQVTGPGGYSWSDSVNLGSLVSGGIWGLDTVTTWPIPSTVSNGEYFIQLTVSSPSGDENWSDNTQTKSIYVSDEEPPAHMQYWYRFHQLSWTSSPDLPPPFDTWGCFGPATTSYDGKTYQVWATPSSSEWRFYIKDTGGTVYRDFYDSARDEEVAYYEDNDNLLFGATDMWSTEGILWMKLGHPATGASLTPPIQSVEMGQDGVYTVYVPCSTCDFDNARVYEATEGDDPPFEFFHTEWDSYDISGYGPSFTLELTPYQMEVESFAFDTREQDLTTANYIVYGKIEGYQPIDNPPDVNITSPQNGQTVFGSQAVAATATDDKGISRVEFYVDSVLRGTDTASPYSYSWDTTSFSDGSHELRAVAHDSGGQTDSHTVNATVDNNPPGISNVTHSPPSPTDSEAVTVQATIADVSGVSVANLHYSDDGGATWTTVAMSSAVGDTWQAMIPANDAGTILYNLQATDGLARTTATADYSYPVTDETPPIFFGWSETPSNLTEDSVGSFRVTVSVADSGGSGLVGQIPQLDYRFDTASYDGYEDMTSAGGSSWLFDVPAPDWDAFKGQTLYYMVRCTDVAGNLGTGTEQSELIDSLNDQPEITSYTPLDLDPEVDVGACIEFGVTAEDADSDPLNYEWRLDSSTVSTADSYTYCPGEQEIGDHSVVALVSDGIATGFRSWQVTAVGGLQIFHTPVTSAMEGTSIPLNATVTSSSPPLDVTLFYRVTGDSTYEVTPMTNTTGDLYEGTIPASAVTLAGVDYYIGATDGTFTTTHPPSGYHQIDVLTFCDTVSEISSTECEALVALYEGTDGPNWAENTGWLETNTPCSWYGITCGIGIESIDLDGNQLNGVIPSALGGLSNLAALNLDYNQLAGSIPPALGELTNLTILHLRGNSLEGEIPAEIGSLSRLRVLRLGHNQLSGGIPASIGSLANLEYLSLVDNHLIGGIPPELCTLTNLTDLYLYGNQLAGSIPPALGNLTSLQHLYLDNNYLEGQIPAEIGSLSSLRDLRLRGNQLDGSIPPTIGDLTNLEALFLNGNQLDGSIPSELGDLTNLRYLFLSNNQLVGDIPPELGDLSSLNYLGLSANRLDGAIPDKLGELTGLIHLNIGQNSLGGEVPPAITNLVNLDTDMYQSDFGYNKLFTSNPEVRSFLDAKDPDWADTQTVAPSDLQVTDVTPSSVQLAWTPIDYTWDGGYYEVGYSDTPGGPYTIHGTTPDKTASGYLADGLLSNTTYYFVVRTHTPTHDVQQNDLWSSYSLEVDAALQESCHSLALASTGSGIDPVSFPSSSPGCPEGHYVAEERIALFASPDAGWTVRGWTGTENNTSTSTTNRLIMPAMDHTVAVTYVEVGWNVELVGQIGGTTSAVAVQDGFAYLSEGVRLTVLDISNPADPIVTAKTDAMAGFARDIAVDDSHAYVAFDIGLGVFDVSDPAHPAQLGFCATAYGAQEVVLDGDLAYIAAGDAGLWIVDVSEPTNPVIIGSYLAPGYVYDVAVAEDHAYFTRSTGGINSILQVLDVSDPSNPVGIGSAEFQGYAHGVVVAGNYAYIAADGLVVMDISDPAAPLEVARAYRDVCDVTDVALYGNYVYVLDRAGVMTTHGVYVFDVSDPTTPIEETYYQTRGHPADMVLRSGYAYIADDYIGLRILDVTDPSEPWQVGLYDAPPTAEDVVAADGFSYVADFLGYFDYGLRVLNVSDPSNPEDWAFLDEPGSYGDITDMVVSGELLYTTGDEGLRVLDVSDPLAPAPVGLWPIVSYPTGLALAGDLAYVAVSGEGLLIVNVSEPSAAYPVGQLDIPGYPQDVALAGEYAYITAGSEGLRVVDISNPVVPREVGRWDEAVFAHQLAIFGVHVYVIDEGGRIWVVDVSDPANPMTSGSYDLPYPYSQGITIADTHAYVANAYAGLRVLDISDPEHLTEVGYYDTAGYARGVAVSGEHLYIADSTGGLAILRFEDSPRDPFVVTSAADSGRGTLRQALFDAGSGDTILFDEAVFPLGDPTSIQLSSALPSITQGNLSLDASNSGVILDGSALPSGNGLHVSSSGNVIKGLQILNFPFYGIQIDGGASHNTIGGPTDADRNVITYNGWSGVSIQGTWTANNIIQNNWIGIDADSTGGLDPRDLVVAEDGTIFLADYGRGVFRSTDSGSSWMAATGGLSTLRIELVAVSPNYATDGHVWVWGEGQLFASQNRGVNWSELGSVLPGNLNALEVSPDYASDQSLMAAVAESGIYRSTDSGASWLLVLATQDPECIAFSPDFASDQVVLAGRTWNGVLRSADGGVSWVDSNTGLSGGGVKDLAFARDGQTVLLISDNCSSDGVYRSADAGQTWTASGEGLKDCGPEWQIALSPGFASDGVAFAVEDSVHRSVDGGFTWSWASVGAFGSRGRALAFSPEFSVDQSAYLVNFAGVFRTTDGGEHWTWAGANLADRGNGGDGVEVCCGAGPNEVLDNVIGRNAGSGISIRDPEAAGSLVEGNLVGLAPDGATRAANGGTNIRIDTPYVTIGDNTSAAGSHGGLRTGVDAHDLTIISNRFGTDLSGTMAIGNSYDGITLESSWDTVRENLVSGNLGGGIYASENVATSSHSTFAGNLIGVDATGTQPLPNENDGIVLTGSYHIVGGTSPADRNIIAGNGSHGVGLRMGAHHNTIVGNYIGIDITGAAIMPNQGQGVLIYDGAEYNTIGGDTDSEHNVISGNHGNGIFVYGSDSLYNTVARNSIYENGGLGINLVGGGNTELPSPVVAMWDQMAGTASGTACAGCTVEVFSDEYDEARWFEGRTQADEHGNWSIAKGSPFTGLHLSVTGTDAAGNTSELGHDQPPAPPPAPFIAAPVCGVTNQREPIFTGAAQMGSLVRLGSGGLPLGQDEAGDWNRWEVPSVKILPDASYLITATATTVWGTSPASELNLTVDSGLCYDPVGVTFTQLGITQHPRDADGCADPGAESLMASLWPNAEITISVPVRDPAATVYVEVNSIRHDLSDLDGDGLFTGSFFPPSSGSLVILLVVDCGAGPQTMQIGSTIDPDGYVYDTELTASLGVTQTIEGVTVTLYVSDTLRSKWVMWDAGLYGQVNPQLTGADGYFAFFTPPGGYKLSVDPGSLGFFPYESPVLTVVREPIRYNVGLRPARRVHLPLVVRGH